MPELPAPDGCDPEGGVGEELTELDGIWLVELAWLCCRLVDTDWPAASAVPAAADSDCAPALAPADNDCTGVAAAAAAGWDTAGAGFAAAGAAGWETAAD